MARNFIFFISFLFIFSINFAKDKPQTHTIKSNLPVAQIAVYEHWIKNVLDSFYNVGPGKKLEFTPVITIFDKRNSWPMPHVFYGENFFGLQPSKLTDTRIEFSPYKEIVGLGNNEYAFKYAIANYLVKNNINSKMPYWFEKGLSAYIASKGGDKSWVERNYSYILFLSTENKEIKSIEQVFNFRTNFDTKERFLQEAYSWAFVNWVMTQKEYVDAPNKILSFSNPENKQNFEELKKKNSEWVMYLETIFLKALPSLIKVSADCETVLNLEDLKGLFFTIRKRGNIVTDNEFVSMLGATIQEATYKNLVALTSSMQPTIREFAVRTLGLIPNRTALPALISIAYNDPSEAVRIEGAMAIRNLNKGIAPKELIDALTEEDPNLVGQVALSLSAIRDPTIAKNLIQKLGVIRPESNTFSVVTTKNYVKDLDVIDGVLVPIIGTCKEGFETKETFLWVIELKNKLILSLNQLPLNHQAQTAEIWYKWYAAQ
jgi:hypothetical protein